MGRFVLAGGGCISSVKSADKGLLTGAGTAKDASGAERGYWEAVGALTLCLVPKGSKPPTAQAQCSHLDAARNLATSHMCFSKLPP